MLRLRVRVAATATLAVPSTPPLAAVVVMLLWRTGFAFSRLRLVAAVLAASIQVSIKVEVFFPLVVDVQQRQRSHDRIAGSLGVGSATVRWLGANDGRQRQKLVVQYRACIRSKPRCALVRVLQFRCRHLRGGVHLDGRRVPVRGVGEASQVGVVVRRRVGTEQFPLCARCGLRWHWRHRVGRCVHHAHVVCRVRVAHATTCVSV